MKIEYDASGSIIVQQTANTAFTGTILTDRAYAANAGLFLFARRPGTEANGYRLVIEPVSGGRLSLEVRSPANAILLRDFSPTNLQGDLVAVVNKHFRSHFLASTISPAAAVVAPMTLMLVGGLDPQIAADCQYKYAAVDNPGLFYFDQPQCYVVTQVEGLFTLASQKEVFVDVINLNDGLMPIASEWAPVYCSQLDATNNGFVITDVKLQLHRQRALRVRMDVPGVVRVQVRREAPSPNT